MTALLTQHNVETDPGMRQSAKKVEKLLQIWVVVDKQDLPALRNMASEFGSLLGQEVMYYEVSQLEVEFLEPEESEEPNHE